MHRKAETMFAARGLRRRTAQSRKGTATQYTVVRNALFPAVVYFAPHVCSSQARKFSRPSTSPAFKSARQSLFGLLRANGTSSAAAGPKRVSRIQAGVTWSAAHFVAANDTPQMTVTNSSPNSAAGVRFRMALKRSTPISQTPLLYHFSHACATFRPLPRRKKIRSFLKRRIVL